MRYFTIVLLAVGAVAQVSALPAHQDGLALRHDLEARYRAYVDGVKYHVNTLPKRGRLPKPTVARPTKPKPEPAPKPAGGSCCTIMRRDERKRGLGEW